MKFLKQAVKAMIEKPKFFVFKERKRKKRYTGF